MKNLTIREYLPEDSAADKDALLPAFLTIWNNPENLKYLSLTLKPFEEEVVSFWLDNHKAAGAQYFCAENEEYHILGIAVIKVSTIEGFELFGLGIHPEFKRQGIGRKLVEYTIRHGANLGFKAIDVSIFADNAAMLTMSLLSGFTPSGMDFNKRADGADIVHLKKYL